MVVHIVGNMYKEIEGDLIELALKGEFDAITHGCNCFCTMGAGVAVSMKNTFGCDKYKLEDQKYKGDINKLGQIDYAVLIINPVEKTVYRQSFAKILHPHRYLVVINSYTQYRYGANHTDGVSKPFDYEAFRLCMRKINFTFKGKHIGMPMIGSHLAGGDWEKIKQIIINETNDCDVTVVIYNK